jgi:hypothetical protein
MMGCSAVPTRFTPVNPIHPSEFSHDLFGQVLDAHVKDGVVDYPAIQNDGHFTAYLAQLERVAPDTYAARHERLAFWINAYNAFAMKGIVDQYSPTSMIGRYRYFIGRNYRVGGATINLYDLERQVLIKQFQEPLIHFAIVCASVSCPKLQSWAYQPHQLDRQLNLAAKAFINDPTRNRFDRTRRIASVSKIFDWFEADFVAAAGSILAYVAQYVDDPTLAKELTQPGYRVEFLDYDWSLNGIPPMETAHAGPS